jgi:hypothetical protein
MMLKYFFNQFLQFSPLNRSWCDIFSSSKRLSKLLHLHLTKNFFDSHTFTSLPSVPITSITLSNIFITNGSDYFTYHSPETFAQSDNAVYLTLILQVIKKYQKSIESFTLKHVHMPIVENLRDMLKHLQNLRHFTAIDLDFLSYTSPCLLHLPHLKTIAITKTNPHRQNSEDLFKLFKLCKTIEKVTFNVLPWSLHGFHHDTLDRFLESLPNLGHLSMHGHGTITYFEDGKFPFKLERLDAFLVGFECSGRRPKLRFLESQVGVLKELRLMRLPCDFNGDELLRFVLDEMNLKVFKYGDIALIMKGERQMVEKAWFNEITVGAGMELLRQFPSEF